MTQQPDSFGGGAGDAFGIAGVLRGEIAPDGSRVNGDGWSSNLLPPGHLYEVNFAAPFTAPPAILIGFQDGGGSEWAIKVSSRNANGFAVFFLSGLNAFVNPPWWFVALSIG